ncbi:hypothetical protein BUALT_Bualt07G0006600 [Buddleja alternifolia]|uniref:GRF-type domain-containing protein n=1 Tax=Buddleja alternifolia TaxID=168488 RepID=A0AAV6XDG0_9LAMI|nr:hypothetical protein BUALT_Bualt07G0006600 [Buddleja alternifolia]
MWVLTAEEFIMNEFCPCGTNTVMKTSWTNHNPGRRYIACERFKQINGCNYYFVWIDPPICTRARQIIPGLLRRVNRFEEDLNRFEEDLKKKRNRFMFIIKPYLPNHRDAVMFDV